MRRCELGLRISQYLEHVPKWYIIWFNFLAKKVFQNVMNSQIEGEVFSNA